MDYVEKESLSKAEAVFAACVALGIEEKDAQIQVLSPAGSRRVKVRVGRPGAQMPAGDAAPASAPPAPQAPSYAERPEAGGLKPASEVPAYVERPAQPPVSSSYSKPAEYAPRTSVRKQPTPEQAEALRSDLEQMLEKMGTPSKLEVKEHAGNTVINLTGEKEGLLIGKRGMTLEALQTVAEQILHTSTGDHSLYVVIDIADYRFRQERKLMDQAKELANMVLADGMQQTMGPLNPAERRVVHMEIKAMEGVESFSVGSGASKKIVIQKKGE